MFQALVRELRTHNIAAVHGTHHMGTLYRREFEEIQADHFNEALTRILGVVVRTCRREELTRIFHLHVAEEVNFIQGGQDMIKWKIGFSD